jgi:lysophospholipase L1-like esterase
MNKTWFMALLLFSLSCACAAQTINPNQIRPSTNSGDVLTTVVGGQPPSWHPSQAGGGSPTFLACWLTATTLTSCNATDTGGVLSVLEELAVQGSTTKPNMSLLEVTPATPGLVNYENQWADATAHWPKFNPNNTASYFEIGADAAGTPGNCWIVGAALYDATSGSCGMSFNPTIVPPVSGQFVVLYPETGSGGTAGSCISQAAVAGANGLSAWGGYGATNCNSGATRVGTFVYSNFSLARYGISPSNVTAVYFASVNSLTQQGTPNASGTGTCGVGGSGSYDVTPTTGNFWISQQFTSVLTSITGAQLATSGCTFGLGGSSNGNPGGTAFQIDSVVAIVYYTGSPVTPVNFVNVTPPITYNAGSNMLGIDTNFPFPGVDVQPQTVAFLSTIENATAIGTAVWTVDGTSATDCTVGGGTINAFPHFCYLPNTLLWTAYNPGGGTPASPVGSVQIDASGSFGASDKTTILNTQPIPDYLDAARFPLANWLQAMHDSSLTAAHLAIIGDSYPICDVTICATGPTVSTNRWAEQLRINLQNAYGYGGTGIMPLSFSVSGININTENYPTTTGTLDNSTGSLGPSGGMGNALIHLPTGATVTFNPGHALSSPLTYDTLIIYCMTNSGSGSLAVSIDSGAHTGTACGTTSGSPTAHAVSISAGSLTTHTAVVTSTGDSYIYAMEGTAGTTGVRVSNLGYGGATAGYFGSSATAQLAFSDLEPAGTKGAIVMLQTNDISQSVAVSTFSTNMGNIISHELGLASAPSIMLEVPPVSSVSGSFPASSYTAAQQALYVADAVDLGNIQWQWGTTFNSGSGLWSTDNIHPNDRGALSIYSQVRSKFIDNTPVQVGSSAAVVDPGFGTLAVDVESAYSGANAGAKLIACLADGTLAPGAICDMRGILKEVTQPVSLGTAPIEVGRNGPQSVLWPSCDGPTNSFCGAVVNTSSTTLATPSAPTISCSTTGGNYHTSGTTIFAKVNYRTGDAVSASSTEVSCTLASTTTGSVTVTGPASCPTYTSEYDVTMSLTTGTETLQMNQSCGAAAVFTNQDLFPISSAAPTTATAVPCFIVHNNKSQFYSLFTGQTGFPFYTTSGATCTDMLATTDNGYSGISNIFLFDNGAGAHIAHGMADNGVYVGSIRDHITINAGTVNGLNIFGQVNDVTYNLPSLACSSNSCDPLNISWWPQTVGDGESLATLNFRGMLISTKANASNTGNGIRITGRPATGSTFWESVASGVEGINIDGASLEMGAASTNAILATDFTGLNITASKITRASFGGTAAVNINQTWNHSGQPYQSGNVSIDGASHIESFTDVVLNNVSTDPAATIAGVSGVSFDVPYKWGGGTSSLATPDYSYSILDQPVVFGVASPVTAATYIDSSLTPGTSPLCAHGTNGAFTNVGCSGGSGGISNITIAVTGASQGATSCTSPATATMTGVATTSHVTASYTADPTSLTGWGATGGMVFDVWPSATNTVSWIACNQTITSITYSSITFSIGAQ